MTDDPMKTVGWHPMRLLPDGHEKLVLIRCQSDRIRVANGTRREYDALEGRKYWCPLEPLLALIPEPLKLSERMDREHGGEWHSEVREDCPFCLAIDRLRELGE